MLFLDDSGKPDVNHPSKAVVIAGFSLPSEKVAVLARQVLGAKRHHFPKRGQPTTWEIKAADFTKPNPWKRKVNRDFTFEVVRIVESLAGTVYSVTIDKSRMIHAMSLGTTMPLQLQALAEHFAVECEHHQETGVVVADWSSHHADDHASTCIASFVASRKLRLHPSVYYASSKATQAIQVADLIAGVRRRVAEGDLTLRELSSRMEEARSLPSTGELKTFRSRGYQTKIQLF
jgi:hypothetical protein